MSNSVHEDIKLYAPIIDINAISRIYDFSFLSVNLRSMTVEHSLSGLPSGSLDAGHLMTWHSTRLERKCLEFRSVPSVLSVTQLGGTVPDHALSFSTATDRRLCSADSGSYR